MGETISGDPKDLAQRLATRGNRIIVLDGADNAGKTMLMADVARYLNRCKCIDVDGFLDRNKNVFVDAIRFDELRQKVLAGLEKSEFVLLATVCARAVVDRLGIPKPIFVYVQPEDGGNSSAAIAEKYGEIESSVLFHREVEEYHRDYKPRRNSDFCYIRKIGL